MTRSAAREVYDVDHIRESILGLLPPRDLTRMMRVSKKGMFLVARELYRSVDFPRVKLRMALSGIRRRMYCDAVVEVSILPRDITLSLSKRLGNHHKMSFQERNDEYHGYQPAIFNLLVPILRNKCSGLRRITYGVDDYSRSPPKGSWIVHFDQARSAGSTTDTGRIEVLYEYKFRSWESPPTLFVPPAAPSAGYTLTTRFNMSFSYETPFYQPAAWLLALQSGPRFANLHSSILFGGLEVSLDEITALYRRQVAVSTDVRLSCIRAGRILPWSTIDFDTFASIARSSLSSLILCSTKRETKIRDRRGNITFSDLPNLVSSIRDHLPNLLTLLIAINDIDKAEAVCQRFLMPDTLQEGGSITRLGIRTSGQPSSLLNTIRCLSMICRADAEVIVECGGDSNWNSSWSAMSQTAYLAYLRAQSPTRQAHLATFDFATLGITRPSDVLGLEYSLDGKPTRRASVCEFDPYAAVAANILRSISEPSDQDFLLDLLHGIWGLHSASYTHALTTVNVDHVWGVFHQYLGVKEWSGIFPDVMAHDLRRCWEHVHSS